MNASEPTEQPPLPKEEFVLKSGMAIFMVWDLAILLGIFPGMIALYFWRWPGALFVCLLVGVWATKETLRLVGLRVVMGPSGFEVFQRQNSLGAVGWDEIEQVRERGLWLVVETKNWTEAWVPQKINDKFSGRWMLSLLRPYKAPRRYFWTPWPPRTQVVASALSLLFGIGLVKLAGLRGMEEYDADQMRVFYLRIAALSLGVVLAMGGMLGLTAVWALWEDKRLKVKGVSQGAAGKGNEATFSRFVRLTNPSLTPLNMEPGCRYVYCAPEYFKEKLGSVVAIFVLSGLLGGFFAMAFFTRGGAGVGIGGLCLVACFMAIAACLVPLGLRLKRVSNDQFKVTVTELWVFRKDERLVFPLDSRTEPKPNKRYSYPLSWCEQFTNEAGKVYLLDRRLIVPVDDETSNISPGLGSE